MSLSLEYRSRDAPPLQFDEKDVKALVTGAIKSFAEVSAPAPQHRMVPMKRHFFYNRLATSLRVINYRTMKVADNDFGEGNIVESISPLHFEATGAVVLLRDGSVHSVVATDMPDRSIKLSVHKLAEVKGATALCALQSNGTTHSAANQWSGKQVLAFSSDSSKTVSVTRIAVSQDGAEVTKQDQFTLSSASLGSTFGNSVASCSAGPNGFASIVGSNGAVQILHETSLDKGVLSKALVAHNETGVDQALFIPRDVVTADLDPSIAASSSSSSSSSSATIMTVAKGGHEIRLWAIKAPSSGGSVSLLQTIAFANDTEENGDRVATVDPSGDMILLLGRKNAASLIALEPDTDRSAIRRITEWQLPSSDASSGGCGPVVSCGACPMKDSSARFGLFVRTEKGCARFTFDSRISGAANVEGAKKEGEGESAASEGDNNKSSTAAAGGGGGGDNVGKWFNKNNSVEASSSSKTKSEGSGAAAATAGGVSKAEVQAAVDKAVSESTRAHVVSASRFAQGTEELVKDLEGSLGQALGALRVPGVKQHSHDIAAAWAQKATRAIEEVCRVAAKQAQANVAAAQQSGSATAASSLSSTTVQNFSPTLAQNFYTSFLDNIHHAAATVVEHSLEKLLDASIHDAVAKSWNTIQNTIERGDAIASGTGEKLVPRVSALQPFIKFSEAIVADQTSQNQSVKRQVEQNKRDLAMYTSEKSNEAQAASLARGEAYLNQLQGAVRDLDSAIVAAKSGSSAASASALSGTAAVTPANEDQVFAKLQELAKKGSWREASTIVANGGSLSLLSRFFNSTELENDDNFEAVCCSRGMAPASFVSLLKILNKGLASAPPVALTERVKLMKRIIVPFALEMSDESAEGNSSLSEVRKFFAGSGIRGEVEEIVRELGRVSGADKKTMKDAALAGKALKSIVE